MKTDTMKTTGDKMTLDQLRKALAGHGMAAVPENLIRDIDGKLERARNCIEQGNDGDGLVRVCQAQDLIQAVQEEE